MDVAFTNGLVNVETLVSDVRNYKEDFDELGLGDIDSTIQLIASIDGSSKWFNFDITAKDMARR